LKDQPVPASNLYPKPFNDIFAHVAGAGMRIIFDVGANDGESCSAYATAFPDSTIFAFEPVGETFLKLKANVGARQNIKLINIAAGDTDGPVPMRINGTSGMNRVVAPATAAGATFVQSRRLDHFCREHGIEHNDFLKIDTEGYDLAVLRGCGDFIQKIDFIQCEASANRYNNFHKPYADIFNFMTSRDFYLFGIYGQTLEWGNGGYPVCRRFDPVFVNRSVVGPLVNVVTM
jgi:FkbM family methyltransferase